MLKLYRFSDGQDEYWETWENGDGSHIVHWGVLGTEGDTKEVRPSPAGEPGDIIQREVDDRVEQGYHPLDIEDHYTLLIEYAVDGMGTEADLEKRARLQERMDQTLGWTGLGECDGGSIGSGTMEVCNFVVDFDLAKAVIEQDLAGTEFADYTRIYDEDEDDAEEDEGVRHGDSI